MRPQNQVSFHLSIVSISNFMFKLTFNKEDICFIYLVVKKVLVLSRPKYFGRQCDINDIQL
jgi:hypothetical protein